MWAAASVLQLLVCSLLCRYSVYYYMMRGALFWSCVFGVLIAPCVWTGNFSPNSEKFSIKIILKLFSMPLEWDFSPVPIIFGLVFWEGLCVLKSPLFSRSCLCACQMAPAIPSCLQAWYFILFIIHCVAEIFHRVLNLTYWFFLPFEIVFFPQISLLNLCFISYHPHLYFLQLFKCVLH